MTTSLVPPMGLALLPRMPGAQREWLGSVSCAQTTMSLPCQRTTRGSVLMPRPWPADNWVQTGATSGFGVGRTGQCGDGCGGAQRDGGSGGKGPVRTKSHDIGPLGQWRHGRHRHAISARTQSLWSRRRYIRRSYSPPSCSSTGNAATSCSRPASDNDESRCNSCAVRRLRIRSSESRPCSVSRRKLTRPSVGSVEPGDHAHPLEGRDQPGECRRADALEGRELTGADRLVLLDPYERRELGQGQPVVGVLAELAVDARDGEPHPGGELGLVERLGGADPLIRLHRLPFLLVRRTLPTASSHLSLILASARPEP